MEFQSQIHTHFSTEHFLSFITICWFDFIFIDDENTPPGTPSPPYKIKQSKSAPQHMSDSKHIRLHPSFNERTNSGSHVLGEHDEFMPNDSLFHTSTTSAGSFAGANISSVNSLQRQIISMDEYEFADDQDSISGKEDLFLINYCII